MIEHFRRSGWIACLALALAGATHQAVAAETTIRNGVFWKDSAGTPRGTAATAPVVGGVTGVVTAGEVGVVAATASSSPPPQAVTANAAPSNNALRLRCPRAAGDGRSVKGVRMAVSMSGNVAG